MLAEFIALLTYETGIAFMLTAIPLLVGIRLLLKELFQNNTNTNRLQIINDDINKVKDDMDKLKKDLSELKLQLASSGSEQKFASINVQITDIKNQVSKLQDRLEKLTDLAIQILGKD